MGLDNKGTCYLITRSPVADDQNKVGSLAWSPRFCALAFSECRKGSVISPHSLKALFPDTKLAVEECDCVLISGF